MSQKVEKIRMADRRKTYCAGWASSSLCGTCAKYSAKYEFLRDIDYTIIRAWDVPPTIVCFDYVREKKQAEISEMDERFR